MSLGRWFLVAAVICFVIVAVPGWGFDGINELGLGLGFFAGSFLVK